MLFLTDYCTFERAEQLAQPGQHILEVYGKGFCVVDSDFNTDRMYFHGEGGKKMFFDVVSTIPLPDVLQK